MLEILRRVLLYSQLRCPFDAMGIAVINGVDIDREFDTWEMQRHVGHKQS
jgi:hypothetical protein